LSYPPERGCAGRGGRQNPLLRPPPPTGGRRSGRAASPGRLEVSVTTAECGRCCLCHSPTLRPWIARRAGYARPASSYVEELWSPSVGRCLEKCKLKQTFIQRFLEPGSANGLSLSGGASIRSRTCSRWASPTVSRRMVKVGGTKRTTRGSPSLKAANAYCR